MFYFAQLAFYE